jgi:hypothetical protein
VGARRWRRAEREGEVKGWKFLVLLGMKMKDLLFWVEAHVLDINVVVEGGHGGGRWGRTR